MLAPDVLGKHGAGDDLAGVPQEILEDGKLTGSEIDAARATRGDAFRRVDGQVGDPQHQWRLVATAPEQGVQARHQLGKCEGLAQIVVGAGIEARDAIFNRSTGSENQHGQIHASLAQAPEQLTTVRIRETQVEDHHVVGVE